MPLMFHLFKGAVTSVILPVTIAYWVYKERLYIFVTRGATPRPMGRELYLTWTNILYFKLTVLTEWDFQVVSLG